jgi:hypothetical protein
MSGLRWFAKATASSTVYDTGPAAQTETGSNKQRKVTTDRTRGIDFLVSLANLAFSIKIPAS